MSAESSSWGDASKILAASGVAEDTSYYRQFTEPDEKAVATVGQRIQAAWAANDADIFASVFTENGSLLMRDDQLRGREEIRSFMAKGFEGPFRGARVSGWPLEIKFPSDDVAMMVTQGGILLKGDKEVHPEREIRAVWMIVKRAPGQLELLSHQSSPIKG